MWFCGSDDYQFLFLSNFRIFGKWCYPEVCYLYAPLACGFGFGCGIARWMMGVYRHLCVLYDVGQIKGMCLCVLVMGLGLGEFVELGYRILGERFMSLE